MSWNRPYRIERPDDGQPSHEQTSPLVIPISGDYDDDDPAMAPQPQHYMLPENYNRVPSFDDPSQWHSVRYGPIDDMETDPPGLIFSGPIHRPIPDSVAPSLNPYSGPQRRRRSDSTSEPSDPADHETPQPPLLNTSIPIQWIQTQPPDPNQNPAQRPRYF
ncbi:hypothetical protein IWQ60_003103 [Tieghemiomyces parasiticus]|uniref:Uncharacterized protein n=1 Tax=Tieghemiomyces parasiticus TaxID=78921 RepID=A0A9W8E100_9FUNG|nr:hypothetical protein IWQ60_003103 [Tieghemiomyces parasiticus]